MKKILRFAKKKRKFSPNTSDTGSVVSVGYELKDKDLGKLHKAASTGDLPKLRQLIKKNDVNQLDKENRAPLHLACASGHAEAVAFLVENKSKLNICDNDNRSPLMKAVQCQQERCAVVLLSHNADPNLVDINGNTALHLAALIPNISLVIHLVEHEAHMNARNKDGYTPLLLAVIENHQEIVEFLLKEGADVNAKDKTGRTALMIAASNGQISLVKLLLRFDANVSLKEDKGWTAEDHAMMNGHHACSHLITEYDTKKKLHQSPYYGTSKVKGDHAAEVGFALGGPATDKEEFQESPEQKWRTSDSEKVADDASQTESVSRASKGAGDSWLSSNEDEELQFSSKVSQKFSLTKLLNTSQKSKENVNAKTDSGVVQNMDLLHPVESDIDSEEESEEDGQDEEEINENSCSLTQPSPQAKKPLLASHQTTVASASSFIKAQSSSTPFKGCKQDKSSEEEMWPVETCSANSRASAMHPVNLDGSSTYAAQAKETSKQKNRRDLLLELGLEEMEAEEHIESPWDSESATESPQRKSFVSSPVKNQAKMQHVTTSQNNGSLGLNTMAQPLVEPSEGKKEKSDLIAELGLIDAGDTEDTSDWDSASVSGKKVSPNVFNSTPQVNVIRKDDKPALQSVQSPKKETSNTKTPINISKSNSEETTCIHRTSQSEGSPDLLKSGLASHPSAQYQVGPELQFKNTTSVKQENVSELKISPSEEEDNEKEEKKDWKMEKDKYILETSSTDDKLPTKNPQSANQAHEGVLLSYQKADKVNLNEEPDFDSSESPPEDMGINEKSELALKKRYVKVWVEKGKSEIASHLETLTVELKQRFEELQQNKNGAITMEYSEDCDEKYSTDESNKEIVIATLKNNENTTLEEGRYDERDCKILHLIPEQQELQDFSIGPTDASHEQQTFHKVPESKPAVNNDENSLEHTCAPEEVSKSKELKWKTTQDYQIATLDLPILKEQGTDVAGYITDLDSDADDASLKLHSGTDNKNPNSLEKTLKHSTELEFSSTRKEGIVSKCISHLDVRNRETPLDDLESYPRNLQLASVAAAKPYLDDELEEDMQRFKNEVGMLKAVFLALEKKKVQLQKEVEEEKTKNFQNRERSRHDELGISESAGKDEDSLCTTQKQTHEQSFQQQNSERLELKLTKGHGDSSKQLQGTVTSQLDKEKRTKDRTKKTLFKGTVLGTDEENYESHQRNQPKQADQDLKNIELKSIERLVKLQQISTMNGDTLSAFDDSTTSEMSQDEVRPFKSSASKKFTRPVNVSDDLDDLTQSSDTATDGSESPSSAYKNTPLLIAQLDAEAIDSVSLLKIQNLVREYERAVEREKKRYALLSDKVKYLENERKELHQALDKTRETKSKLECQKMERDTDFNSVKFSLKQEEENRKIAEMLYEKSREQLQKKELQYCEELKAKQELELIIRNMEMERKSLLSNIEQLNEEQNELQKQFNQEQAVHKEILNNHLHRQREKEEEDKKTIKSVEAVAYLCDVNNHEKDMMEQNRSLQDELTVLKIELDCVRARSQEEQGKYMEQIEALKEKLDDTKKDLKFNEETLTDTALQYKGQLNALKTETSMLASKLELEKQNKEKLETEIEAIRSQLSVALQELERSQAAKCESEQILQREHHEWHHSDEKRNYEISSLRETNNSLSQKLSKEEAKANNLDYELHRATLSLAEKNLLLENAQRNLNQSQAQISDLEHSNRLQKEQISKFTIRQESMQERLAQAQSEIMLLRQQLEDAQNKGIIKEKAVTDVQDRFSDIFSKLRRDSERQISLVEERNKELVTKTIEQREQICKFENEKIERETTLRQLQQELADALKKLSMSEASLEVTTRYRNEMEEEKARMQKHLEKLKVELQETQDEYMQSERKIQHLQNALDDKERDVTAISQKMQEVLSASSRKKEAAKQLEEHVQRLEIENAKLESVAKQQTTKSELMEKELQDTVSVRARLEDLITSLQGAKINLEDQLGQEVQKQTMLSQSAKDSHQLWEEELKTRSKLGLRLSQLSREKDDLAGQVEVERKKVKKLVEFKRSVETRLAQEMKRNNELQKELHRKRTLLKTTKKKLKEYDSGQFVTQLSGIQELEHEHSETEITFSKLKTKVDDLSQQLEAESAKCRRLESTNQELSVQVAPMRILQKSQDRLEKRKRQLEEEVASLKHQIETNVTNYSQMEQYKREVEEHARKEIKQKLEEVNLFLQTQQASQEALEQLRSTNESTIRGQLEQRIKNLESELNNLRTSQQDSMNLKESAQLELERYKELYSEELKLRKSLAAKLDRSNERLAETNAKLLNERQRSKSLIASSIMNGSLTTTPTLDMGQLQSTMGHVGNLGTFNKNLGSSFLNPVEDGISSTNRVESYLAKMQEALQKNISKELVQATADLDRGSTRVSPLGSATGSLKSINQDQDPVTKAKEQYLEVLKKNYML
ncbi:ankyrin repeat domain-containing protein 26 isoform X2 [Carcharodon carcharias]|uniref:ankyrin repeat domain-containing protein 26 isoform X2 n=1 Tax=Carcharodon carcharias TaxID=13397 RepID=UPI001B7E631C|nr:ankyrin repeat domain-containing protein 26 isoform X2 [Carcharodon carcharias]